MLQAGKAVAEHLDGIERPEAPGVGVSTCILHSAAFLVRALGADLLWRSALRRIRNSIIRWKTKGQQVSAQGRRRPGTTTAVPLPLSPPQRLTVVAQGGKHADQGPGVSVLLRLRVVDFAVKVFRLRGRGREGQGSSSSSLRQGP